MTGERSRRRGNWGEKETGSNSDHHDLFCTFRVRRQDGPRKYDVVLVRSDSNPISTLRCYKSSIITEKMPTRARRTVLHRRVSDPLSCAISLYIFEGSLAN